MTQFLKSLACTVKQKWTFTFIFILSFVYNRTLLMKEKVTCIASVESHFLAFFA
jgi:hypothetical protein